jgi:hypothetical protein
VLRLVAVDFNVPHLFSLDKAVANDTARRYSRSFNAPECQGARTDRFAWRKKMVAARGWHPRLIRVQSEAVRKS